MLTEEERAALREPTKTELEVARVLYARRTKEKPDAIEEARAVIRAMAEMVPIVRDHEGMAVHELRGAPADIWRVMIDAASPTSLKD